MNAGRELDMLVAESVMGWTFAGFPVGEPAECPDSIPHYSTDIATAWQVVEHMQKRLNSVENRAKFSEDTAYRLEYDGEDWTAGFTYDLVLDCGCPDPLGSYATAETAPLAICLAALKAVGIDV